jgi:hypothetical protein
MLLAQFMIPWVRGIGCFKKNVHAQRESYDSKEAKIYNRKVKGIDNVGFIASFPMGWASFR